MADPVSLFKAAKNEVFWNEKEKETFLEKLLIFGKNFDIIASFLEKKVKKKKTVTKLPNFGDLNVIKMRFSFSSKDHSRLHRVLLLDEKKSQLQTSDP